MEDYESPQSWNLYSYVHGNPVNFNDPMGHDNSSQVLPPATPPGPGGRSNDPNSRLADNLGAATNPEPPKKEEKKSWREQQKEWWKLLKKLLEKLAKSRPLSPPNKIPAAPPNPSSLEDALVKGAKKAGAPSGLGVPGVQAAGETMVEGGAALGEVAPAESLHKFEIALHEAATEEDPGAQKLLDQWDQIKFDALHNQGVYGVKYQAVQEYLQQHEGNYPDHW